MTHPDKNPALRAPALIKKLRAKQMLVNDAACAASKRGDREEASGLSALWYDMSHAAFELERLHQSEVQAKKTGMADEASAQAILMQEGRAMPIPRMGAITDAMVDAAHNALIGCDLRAGSWKGLMRHALECAMQAQEKPAPIHPEMIKRVQQVVHQHLANGGGSPTEEEAQQMAAEILGAEGSSSENSPRT